MDPGKISDLLIGRKPSPLGQGKDSCLLAAWNPLFSERLARSLSIGFLIHGHLVMQRVQQPP